eukprot:1605036-Pleurochrysis_carterae.AAC.2
MFTCKASGGAGIERSFVVPPPSLGERGRQRARLLPRVRRIGGESVVRTMRAVRAVRGLCLPTAPWLQFGPRLRHREQLQDVPRLERALLLARRVQLRDRPAGRLRPRRLRRHAPLQRLEKRRPAPNISAPAHPERSAAAAGGLKARGATLATQLHPAATATITACQRAGIAIAGADDAMAGQASADARVRLAATGGARGGRGSMWCSLAAAPAALCNACHPDRTGARAHRRRRRLLERRRVLRVRSALTPQAAANGRVCRTRRDAHGERRQRRRVRGHCAGRMGVKPTLACEGPIRTGFVLRTLGRALHLLCGTRVWLRRRSLLRARDRGRHVLTQALSLLHSSAGGVSGVGRVGRVGRVSRVGSRRARLLQRRILCGAEGGLLGLSRLEHIRHARQRLPAARPLGHAPPLGHHARLARSWVVRNERTLEVAAGAQAISHARRLAARQPRRRVRRARQRRVRRARHRRMRRRPVAKQQLVALELMGNSRFGTVPATLARIALRGRAYLHLRPRRLHRDGERSTWNGKQALPRARQLRLVALGLKNAGQDRNRAT